MQLRACMLEAIRIEPTVAALSGMVHASDYTVRGRRVPKNSIVVGLKRIACTVASDLEEPLAYKPERWLSADGTLRNEQEVGAGILTFGGGPRACPGRGLAETEVVVMTAAALASFALWTMLQKPEEVKRADVLTIAPGPLGIRFEN